MALECAAAAQSVWLIIKHSWHRTLRWSGIRVSVWVRVFHTPAYWWGTYTVRGCGVVALLSLEAIADLFYQPRNQHKVMEDDLNQKSIPVLSNWLCSSQFPLHTLTWGFPLGDVEGVDVAPTSVAFAHDYRCGTMCFSLTCDVENFTSPFCSCLLIITNPLHFLPHVSSGVYYFYCKPLIRDHVLSSHFVKRLLKCVYPIWHVNFSWLN